MPAHAREVGVHLGAHLLQSSLQQQILLEAVAAAPFGDELALDILASKRHAEAAVRIEVLKGDRGDVRAVHLGDGAAAGQTDPVQVSVEVEHGRDSNRAEVR
jgi:hypothetical protein